MFFSFHSTCVVWSFHRSQPHMLALYLFNSSKSFLFFRFNFRWNWVIFLAHGVGIDVWKWHRKSSSPPKQKCSRWKLLMHFNQNIELSDREHKVLIEMKKFLIFICFVLCLVTAPLINQSDKKFLTKWRHKFTRFSGKKKYVKKFSAFNNAFFKWNNWNEQIVISNSTCTFLWHRKTKVFSLSEKQWTKAEKKFC